MFKKQVTALLETALEENSSLFLIDFSISSDNKIMVTLDGDHGVTLQDCMNISRAIEHNLDREEVDFGLEVASAGAAAPLTLPRQYLKNIGRNLSVRTANDRLEGDIIQASETAVTLQWKARVPKPIGKGKVTVTNEQVIAYTDIIEAKVNIKF